MSSICFCTLLLVMPNTGNECAKYCWSFWPFAVHCVFQIFLGCKNEVLNDTIFFFVANFGFHALHLAAIKQSSKHSCRIQRQFQIFWERRQFPFTAYLLQRFAPVEPAIVFRMRIIKSCRSKNSQLSAIYCPRKLLFQHFCLMFIVVPELHWTNIFHVFTSIP